ncbi:MAG: hypothetical protein IPK87_01930 [Planctomycetes bacterium]|nr:hypothetical protein [Planctomycetota bacterium]
MSDAATQAELRYLELALDEALHGGPDTGLAERIIKAANAPPALAVVAEQPEADVSAGEHLAEPAQLQLAPSVRRSARPWWRYALEGAAAACVAGLFLLLVIPSDPESTLRETPETAHKPAPPEGIKAAPDAKFTQAASGGVNATAGWYVVSQGAPALEIDGHRVEDVQGRAVVVVGKIPEEAEVRAMGTFLYQNDITEAQVMTMNWFQNGALAICLLTGSAWVDNVYVSANDKEVREEKSPEAHLEQLRKDIKDLEAKLERARGIENERERKQKVERIENAIADKKKELEAAELRIAERKRREAEKKEGGKDDNSERRRKDAEEKERKTREEREAKEREERARKERERDETDEEARKRREDFERVRREAEEEARKEAEERKRKEGEKREGERERKEPERRKEGNRERKEPERKS